jgi:hypothetical protein
MTEQSGAESTAALPAVISGKLIKLGGKEFSVVNYDAITALNEHYIMKLMRATGLDVVLPLSQGETDEQYMLRVHAAVVDTLKLHELLAGYLLPLGKTETDWTLALAKETARHIANLTNPDDRAEVHRLGLLVTFDFFRAGLDSLRHSQSVLSAMRGSPRESESSPSSRGAH